MVTDFGSGDETWQEDLSSWQFLQGVGKSATPYYITVRGSVSLKFWERFQLQGDRNGMSGNNQPKKYCMYQLMTVG